MSRISSSFPVNLAWNDYKVGFGDNESNFWLGLEKIYQLTNNGGHSYRLRIEMMALENRK